jgi:hypothetical protein
MRSPPQKLVQGVLMEQRDPVLAAPVRDELAAVHGGA